MGRLFLMLGLLFCLVSVDALPVMAAGERNQDAVLVAWAEIGHSQHGAYSVGFVNQELQIWGYDLTSQSHRTVKVGHLWPVMHLRGLEVLIGGFLADREYHGFIEPWIEFRGHTARLWFDGEFGAYLPISHGETELHSHETFVGYQLNSRWTIGLSTEFLSEGRDAAHLFLGGEARARVSTYTIVGARVLGGSEGLSGRLEVRRTF